MKQELDNSPEEFLRKIAEELTHISGECTEIKQAQLTAATTDDLNNMGTSIASAVADKVNSLQSAINSQSQTVSEIGDNLTTSVNSLTTAVTEKIDNFTANPPVQRHRRIFSPVIIKSLYPFCFDRSKNSNLSCYHIFYDMCTSIK